MDVAAFRAAFPAFTEELHPDARVAFWLAVADKRLPEKRWGDLLDQGTALFVAHNLTLERLAAQDTKGTGGATAAAGPMTSESKTVGPVSKSKAHSQATSSRPEAGPWNATIYGQQFHDLMQIVGAGGLAV